MHGFIAVVNKNRDKFTKAMNVFMFGVLALNHVMRKVGWLKRVIISLSLSNTALQYLYISVDCAVIANVSVSIV